MPDREPVNSEQAPKAIGPYVQAIKAGGFVFASGQIPLDPTTGKLVEGDIRVQTTRVLENLAAIMRGANTELKRAVRCTVFLADMADFPAMNEVYATYFADVPPSRSTVEVRRLPRDARIEIDVIALA